MRFGVDREPAGGVDDDDVVSLAQACLDAGLGDRDRVAEGSGPLMPPPTASCPATLPRSGAKTGTPARWPDDLQLGDGIGALEVGGDEQRRVPLVLEPLAELAGEGRLARALEAGQHDDRRRVLGQPELAGLPAEDRRRAPR
jgi:hypothetical protein